MTGVLDGGYVVPKLLYWAWAAQVPLVAGFLVWNYRSGGVFRVLMSAVAVAACILSLVHVARLAVYIIPTVVLVLSMIVLARNTGRPGRLVLAAATLLLGAAALAAPTLFNHTTLGGDDLVVSLPPAIVVAMCPLLVALLMSLFRRPNAVPDDDWRGRR